ncbi:DUF504 domain-containing protein [Candidatus Woesearchaeota archaeon]|nr:DUF504 domain-containing protein [Candidatus Woesearchaeota archaeon]
MVLREQDRHFLWSLVVAVGGILAWRGIWEGLYEIPYIADDWILLFIGFAILTFSGAIFKEFDPLGSIEKSATNVINYIAQHPRKQEFVIRYKDKTQKEPMAIKGDRLKHMDKGALVFKHDTREEEFFVPLHRVIEVIQNEKSYWKL